MNNVSLYILESNPLALDSAWEEAADGVWPNKATIKIFGDEKQFNEYQKTLQK